MRALSFSSGATNINSVVFDANGGSGSMATQHGTSSTALTSNSFTRSGFNFSGWNTVANGSGTAYANLASYPFSDSRILYAQWTSTNTTVTFKSNYLGGAADTTQSVPLNTSTALTSNPFTRAGYTFSGWTVNEDGTGTSYTDTQSVTLINGLTLYAKWTIRSFTYAFDSNSGTSVTGGTYNYGNSIAKPTDPTLTGKFFGGWSTSETGDQGAIANRIASWPYSPANADITLYAIWNDDQSLTFAGTNPASARNSAAP